MIFSQGDLEELCSEIPEVGEHVLVHAATGILRKSTADIKECYHSYEPSTNINIEHCADFIPDLLCDFISWIY